MKRCDIIKEPSIFIAWKGKGVASTVRVPKHHADVPLISIHRRLPY